MKAYRAFIATTSDLRFVAWKLDFAILRHFVEEVSIHHITSNSPEKYHSFLIPKYSMGCKRIILDPGYLQCLHQSNVELITDAIGEITTEGILTKNGELHDLDVLILATGFDTGVSGIGIDLKGRDGSTVAEQWTKQDGPQAYLGTTIANFPNFYTLLGPNIGTVRLPLLHGIAALFLSQS
jgi:cation diffusion facilitator CzcD-associated flavoprotein CzcO